MSIRYIIAGLGVLNLTLVLFQLLSGLRVIKIPFGIHKKAGITLFISATIHGTLALLGMLL